MELESALNTKCNSEIVDRCIGNDVKQTRIIWKLQNFTLMLPYMV